MTSDLLTSDEIEAAAGALAIKARIEGPNHLVLLDVDLPPEAPESLLPALRAARALHHAIEADDELTDIEETLEDALKADDRRAIDDGCELYRSLLAGRLKALLNARDGSERLAALIAADLRAHGGWAGPEGNPA